VPELADRTVTVTLAANTAPYIAGMARAGAATKGISTAATGMGTAVTGVGAAATQATGPVGKLGKAAGVMGTGFSAVGLAGTVAGVAIGKFAMDSIDAASDLAESQNKVSVVFGKSAGAVRDFGEDAAGSLGMSENAAISAAATFGQFFDAAGLSEKASADMSLELVGLAADLASFNNLDPSVTLEKLRAGLAGETEPLRTVGVFLNEASVQAKAAELGLGGVHGELSEGEKIQARYALILEQTEKAQGDFARTSDGLANKQRILNAELENTKAAFGEKLIPVQQKATETGIDLLDVVNLLLDGYEKLQSWEVKGKPVGSAIFGSIPNLAHEVVDAWNEMFETGRRGGEGTFELAEAQDALGISLDDAAEAAEEQAQEVEDLRDEYDKTMNAALGLRDAEVGWEQALDDLTTSIEQNGTTLDVTTQKGRDNRTALDNIAEAALGVMRQMYDTGASEEAVRVKNEEMRTSLYNSARQFGLSEDAAWAYVDQVLKVPPTAATTVVFSDADARTKIQSFLNYLKTGIPSSIPVSIRATGSGGTGGPLSAFAGSGNRQFPLPGGKGAYPVTKSLHPVNAIDYGARSGTPIYASFSGQLTTANLGNASYGKFYRLSGSGQRPILGAHLSNFARGSGPVAQGTLIGWTGNTGRSTGPHFHLENFDTGGILGHGSAAFNASGRPERVLNPEQTESFDRLVTVLAGSGHGQGVAGPVTNVYINGAILDEGKLLTVLNKATRNGGQLLASGVR